jgi:hypothetical protein
MPVSQINFRVGALQSGLIEGRESGVGPSVESTSGEEAVSGINRSVDHSFTTVARYIT